MVVNCFAQPLFTSEILLRRLAGNMAQQKLDLLQFSAGLVAEPSASPAKVVGREFLDSCLFSTILHNMPDHSLSHPLPPSLTSAADAPKETAFRYAGRLEPRVESKSAPLEELGMASQVE